MTHSLLVIKSWATTNTYYIQSARSLLKRLYRMKAKLIREEYRLKEPVPLECQRCHNQWVYKGKNPFFAICTWCKSTVQIERHKVATATGGLSFQGSGHTIAAETGEPRPPVGAVIPNG
jgi:hypothetical protein